jgi:hypothetical protein
MELEDKFHLVALGHRATAHRKTATRAGWRKVRREVITGWSQKEFFVHWIRGRVVAERLPGTEVSVECERVA